MLIGALTGFNAHFDKSCSVMVVTNTSDDEGRISLRNEE